MGQRRNKRRRSLRRRSAKRDFARHYDQGGYQRSLFHELLEERRLLAADFGDAPAPYPVTLAENGALHEATGPQLGSGRDVELDGTHSVAADADGADEDGVTFGTIMVGQLDATATVNVQNAPSGAKLDAWIDFNSDGNWGGPWEQIASGVAVVNGDNTLEFDVPSWTQSGQTYARFRLSTPGGLGVNGSSADGEVEDYQVTINPPNAVAGIFGGERIITDSANGVRSLIPADINADGDMDLVATSGDDDAIFWYENDGNATNPSFTAHTITSTADGAWKVFVADVNNDGNLDVLSASPWDHKIAWYEHDGNANPSFTTHIITTEANAANSVFAADLDGDGDMDVLSASYVDAKIAWYENDGNTNPSFTTHIITTGLVGPECVFAVDLDSDGDIDVLSASSDDDKIAWYENDGSAIPNFTPHTITITADGALSVFASDIDSDGDIDVLSASYIDNTIAWYQNDGNQNFTPLVINTDTDSAYDVFAADVDGDGDVDVLSASDLDGKIAWYANNGDLTPSFTAHTITTSTKNTRSVFAADLDGNGDMDVLSASLNDNTIAWYKNLSSDFGDAPAPYPVTLAEDGARHDSKGPTLGNRRDHEPDGTHSAAATADDTTGSPDDEDGVTFGAIMVGQLDATATVNVQNAPGGAKLDAWIDFNGDGNWGGPWEQIASGVAVVNGDNTLEFDVPSWAQSGETYARFRLSTTGGLGMGGTAADGEVEDYVVSLDSHPLSTIRFGPAETVGIGADNSRGNDSGDIDGDGDMDIVGIALIGDKILWYENEGNFEFTEHVVSSAIDWPTCAVVHDIDGDGDLDVVSSSHPGDRIYWHENNGAADPSFVTHVISSSVNGPESVFIGDVDGDGDMDVLSASSVDDRIMWHENDGGSIPTFQSHLISTAGNYAYVVHGADVDADGDMDVVSTSHRDNKISWHENDGNAADPSFVTHVISTTARNTQDAFVVDVDNDGDMDVINPSADDNTLSWHQNNGNGTFVERLIGSDYNGALLVFASDINGDGHMDAVLSSNGDRRITWFENNGLENPAFTPHHIGILNEEAHGIHTTDMDGDGRLDVLVGLTSKVVLFRNIVSDFGDAPSPYPVTLAQDGARHDSKGPTLGNIRDHEADGSHSDNADADGTDDDGVTFGIIRPGQLNSAVVANVQNAPSGAKLDAWIDFNADGNWGGAGEQVAHSVSVVSGDNTIEFDVPGWAKPGSSYARFRISTGGSLGVTGNAPDGEVEDYQVTISSAVTADARFDTMHIMTSDAVSARGIHTVDLDNDGDVDVIAALQNDNETAWYENDGNGTFIRHKIYDHLDTESQTAQKVWAADVNGDGHLDVLSASWWDAKVTIHTNDGNENWTHQSLSVPSARAVSSADVDGDGDVDVLTAGSFAGRITWFENNDDGTFNERVLGKTPQIDYAYAVHASDLNRDGYIDVLSATARDNQIAWFENIANVNFEYHSISQTADFVRDVFSADLDGDGDIDVMSADLEANRVSWYENNGDETFTTHVVSANEATVTAVFATDIDGDGDMDILTANPEPGTVSWHENDGSGSFTSHLVGTGRPGSFTIMSIDMDNDGDLDIVSNSQSDGVIAWYENNATPTLDAIANLTFDEDAPEQTVDLTGISAGGSENQAFRVTAASDNTALIQHPVANHTLSTATGSLKFTPVKDQHGTATITVTVEDAGPDGDFDKTADNATFSRSFDVTVTPVNDAPVITVLGQNNLTVEGLRGGQYSDAGATAWDVEDGNLTNDVAVSGDLVNLGKRDTYIVRYDVQDSAELAAAQQTRTVTIVDTLPPVTTLRLDNQVIHISDHSQIGVGGVTNTDPGQPQLTNNTSVGNAAKLANPVYRDTTHKQPDGSDVRSRQDWIGRSPAGAVPDPELPTASAWDRLETPIAVTSAFHRIDLDGTACTENCTVAEVDFAQRSTYLLEYDAHDQTSNHAEQVVFALILDDQTAPVITVAGGPAELVELSSRWSLAESTAADNIDGNLTGNIRYRVQNETTDTLLGSDLTYAEAVNLLTTSTVANYLVTMTVSDAAGIYGNNSANNMTVAHKAIQVQHTVNALPTLDTIGNLTIAEDAAEQTVSFSGVTSGLNENQPLKVTAISSFHGTFATATNFEVGSGPRGASVADFNGDGNQDLAVANRDSDNVSILLGTGSGSFGVATNFMVGDGPYSVAVADFNADGNLDVAVSNFNSANVSILLGNGSGSFSAATNFPVGSVPSSVSVSDFNGDSNQDLAVANRDSDNVSILLGTGSGTFSTATNFAVGNGPHSVAVGDFNGDGNHDLAVGNREDDNVSILLGTGSGSFSAATDFVVGDRPRSVSVADFNGDGNQDLAVANRFSDNVSILLGTGSGSFSAATNFAVGDEAIALSVGDFDSDGNQDLAVANLASDNVSILLGDGGGSFGAATTFAVGENPISVPVGDFDGDGNQDLAVSNFADNNVSILLGVASIIPNPTVTYTTPEATGTLQFTPVPDQYGSTTITVTVEDGGLDNDLNTSEGNATFNRTFDVTITPVNDAPVLATLPNLSFAEGGQIHMTGTKLGDFVSDIDSDKSKIQYRITNLNEINSQLGISIGMDAYSGQFADRSDNSIHVHPATDFNGTATVIVEARDIEGDVSATQSFTVTVTPVNDPPVLATLPAVTLSEGGRIHMTGTKLGDFVSDIDSDKSKIQYRITNLNEINSQLGISIGMDAYSGQFADRSDNSIHVHPATDFNGTATVIVEARDIEGDVSATQSFTVTVTPVNDPPVLATLPAVTLSEGGRIHMTGTKLVDFVSDIDSDKSKIQYRITNLDEIDSQLGISIGMDANSGQFATRSTNSIHVHPATEYNGQATVTVEARDIEGDVSATQSFIVTVTPVNDDPIATNITYQPLENKRFDKGKATGLATLVTDIDEDNLTFSVVAGPNDGQLVLNEDGSFHYTPITDFNRTDSFTYRANDGTVDSNIGTVTLKIDTDYTWYNCREPRDVNADNLVTPLDVLWVINTINNRGSHPLAKIRTEGIVKPFLDVNRDAHATPLDALWVINYLNQRSFGEGEGASETPAAALAIDRLMSEQAMRRERLERANRAVTAVTGSVSQPVLDNTPYWQQLDETLDSIIRPARRSQLSDAAADRDELFEQSDWLDFLGEDEAL